MKNTFLITEGQKCQDAMNKKCIVPDKLPTGEIDMTVFVSEAGDVSFALNVNNGRRFNCLHTKALLCLRSVCQSSLEMVNTGKSTNGSRPRRHPVQRGAT